MTPAPVLHLAGVVLSLTFCCHGAALAQDTRAEFIALFGGKKIAADGGAHMLRYAEVDRHLAAMYDWLKEKGLSEDDPGFTVTFGEIFAPTREDCLFPLTNQVLRGVRDSSLSGLAVLDSRGKRAGNFSNTYLYTRQGEFQFSLRFFQYTTQEGVLEKAGNDLLLDRFGVRWGDVRQVPLLSPPPPGP